MITISDGFTTIDLGAYYAILPSEDRLQNLYKTRGIKHSSVLHGFVCDSGSNPNFLTVEELRALIREHVDASLFRFEPVHKYILNHTFKQHFYYRFCLNTKWFVFSIVFSN